MITLVQFSNIGSLEFVNQIVNITAWNPKCSKRILIDIGVKQRRTYMFEYSFWGMSKKTFFT